MDNIPVKMRGEYGHEHSNFYGNFLAYYVITDCNSMNVIFSRGIEVVVFLSRR